ncbi:hypothetical protein D3C77_817830 [compost metagenome]
MITFSSGTFATRVRSRSCPLMPGSELSVSTASGWARLICSSASSALWHTVTSKPLRLR